MKKLIFILTSIAAFACVKQEISQPDNNVVSLSKPGSLSLSALVASRRVPKSFTTIVYTGKSNFTISYDTITAGTTAGITLNSCNNVTIKYCKFLNGTSTAGVGIALNNCTNVTIDYSFFNSVASGVYAYQSVNTVINGCQFLNMQHYYPRGQAVQFNACKGGSVTNNRIQTIAGQGNPEDNISMFESNGTAASPIYISGNWILDGGTDSSCGGIMLGDGGGSYITATGNVLVNPGQYGIAVAGGTNMTVQSNEVYSAKLDNSNVGVYVDKQSTPGCSVITLNANLVNWTNSAGQSNGFWNANNCGTIVNTANNFYSGITAGILPVSIITYK